MKYDKVTRWIHFGLALFIMAQLLLSLVMQVPKPGRMITSLGAESFQLHRLGGNVILVLLLIHWGWTLAGHLPEGLGHLFPWTDKARMKKVLEDMQPLLKLKIRNLPRTSALAGAVHGLGLTVASFLALTGLVLFYGISLEGRMPPFVHFIKELHEFIGSFMWIYLAGHISMGILHQYIGHRTLSEMFNLSQE